MYDRILTDARRAQGFETQAQLDAFYAYFDHIQACQTCQTPGPAFPMDDGMQPTMQRCEESTALFLSSCEK